MASALRFSFPDPPRDRQPRRASVTVLVPPERVRGERVLVLLKHASSVACSVLLVAAGLAYGDRVYVEVRSDNARDDLTRLKHDAHQLSVSIESLKYQAAQLGESADSDLVLPTPDRFIFVEPSLPDAAPQPTPTAPAAIPPRFPIGY